MSIAYYILTRLTIAQRKYSVGWS